MDKELAKLVIACIALIGVLIIAIINVVNQGNAEHWIHLIIIAALEIAAAFGFIKKNGESKTNS